MRGMSLTAILAHLLAKLLLARLPFGIRPLRIVATRLWIRWLVHKYVLGFARGIDKVLLPVTWCLKRREEPVDMSGE